MSTRWPEGATLAGLAGADPKLKISILTGSSFGPDASRFFLQSMSVSPRPHFHSEVQHRPFPQRRRGFRPRDGCGPFRMEFIRALTSASVTARRSVPFGRYCRTSPLVCPFRPRSQKCWGRACPGRFPDSRSKSHLTGDAAFRPPDANNWPYGAIPGFPAKGAGKRGVALYGAVRRRTGRARGPVWCCRSRQGRAAPFLWRHRCGGHQRSPVRLCHAPSEAP